MLYVQFFAEKMFKKNRSKGTSNVLQGGGSAEYGQIPHFYITNLLSKTKVPFYPRKIKVVYNCILHNKGEIPRHIYIYIFFYIFNRVWPPLLCIDTTLHKYW